MQGQQIRIKDFRQGRFTQRAMADDLGLSERQYRRIEKGNSYPDVLTALRIARSLGATVEELWGGNPTAQS